MHQTNVLWLSAADWQSVGLTLWTAAVSVALILPLGMATAWMLAKRQWLGKSILETLVMLPLVLPPVATGLILLKLCGRHGPVGGWVHRQFGVDILFSQWAVILALSVMAFPLLVKSLRTAFQEVPPRLENVARTLGLGPWGVFFRVTLPLARNGVLAGIVLAFARALGEFGATMMVAGFIPGETSTLALSIYQHVQMGQDSKATPLLVVSIIIALLALWISNLLSRKEPRA